MLPALSADEGLPFSPGDGTPAHPLIVWRERSKDHVRLRPLQYMAESNPDIDDLVVNSKEGYYIVGPETSVIFLSKPKGK